MGGGRNGIIPGLMLGGIGQGGYWAMPGGAIGGMPSGVVLTAVFSEPLSDSLLAGSSCHKKAQIQLKYKIWRMIWIN